MLHNRTRSLNVRIFSVDYCPDSPTSSPPKMIWTSPEWMPQEPFVPNDISIGDFALRAKDTSSVQLDKPVLISAHDRRSFTIAELKARVDKLAIGLSDLLAWSPDTPQTPWDKVVALFAVNSVSHEPISSLRAASLSEATTGLIVMLISLG